MRFLLTFVLTFIFLACSSETKIDLPLSSMQKNEGLWYLLEDESKKRAHLSLEKIDDTSYKTSFIMLDEAKLYLGELNSSKKDFTLKDVNSDEKILATLEFDEDKPVLTLKELDSTYFLSSQKVNTLNFVKHILQEQLNIGLNFTITMIDDAFFLPNSLVAIDNEVRKKINEKIAYGANSMLELKEKLIQKQKEMIKQQKDFSFYIEYINSFMPDYIDDKIIAFKNFSYEYLGGVHGKNDTKYHIFSLENGEQISNKTKDLIQDINDKKLLALLKTKLINASASGLLGVDNSKIALPEDFFINKDGIEFTWKLNNFGLVERIVFRFSELKAHVKKESKLYYLF